jgi:hypothetical protein
MAMKRQLPALERDLDAVKRRKHFVVEIPSKPASHQLHNNHHSTSDINNNNKQAVEATVALSQSIAHSPPEPAPQRPPVAKTNTTNPTNRPIAAAAAAPPPQSHQHLVSAARSSAHKDLSHTRHKEKVANGLRHELDRLQPNEAVTKEQGRKLRSQEATRFKSDLSAYFPDYDEVIGNEPKEQCEHAVPRITRLMSSPNLHAFSGPAADFSLALRRRSLEC